jgi:glycosyltransferase involved in cell wall biosynthesis
LEDGLTGFIVENEQQAIEAVAQISTLDRGRIRAEFERRFTAQHMARNYLKLYSRLVKSQRTGAASHTGTTLRTGGAIYSPA